MNPWLPAMAASVVLAMVVGVGVFLGGNGTNVDADEATTVASPPMTARSSSTI